MATMFLPGGLTCKAACALLQTTNRLRLPCLACCCSVLLHLLLQPIICGDCLPLLAMQAQVAALLHACCYGARLHAE